MPEANPRNDGERVEAARRSPDGDFRTFEALMQRHEKRVYANCRYLTRAPDEAKDLAQEVFIKAFFGLARFEGRSTFGTCLLLAGMALAFGLSFGLGTRDITRDILAGFYGRKVLRVGEDLEIRGERGVLKAITPTHAVVDDGKKTLSIANGTFLDEVAKQ